MNNAINELVRSIVKKNSLAECSVSELQRLTTQYPYFGPVQFLLARKLKEENSGQYAKQSQKAILYFQDDLWFDYVTNSRLTDLVFTNGIEKTETLPAIKKAEITEPASPVQPAIAPPAITETVATYDNPVEAIVERSEEIIEPEQEEVVETIDTNKEADQSTIEPLASHSAIVETYRQPAEAVETDKETAVEEKPFETFNQPEEIVDPAIEQPEPAHPVVPEKAPVEYDDAIGSSVIPEVSVIEPAIEQPVEPMGPDDVGSESEEIPDTKDLPPLPGFKLEPFNPETAKLSFEPYHTVDYFASQGIKFREEEKPKDRFGQQLKSFTEWLKTLKKVPETGAPSVTANGPEDKNVTQMAQHSLDEREVVTEAMADVWEKQGNHAKAIETYRKLSLLNPSKSAYFAAKIEHLKQV